MKTIYTSREEEEMHGPIDGHIDTKTYSYIYLYIDLYGHSYRHRKVASFHFQSYRVYL